MACVVIAKPNYDWHSSLGVTIGCYPFKPVALLEQNNFDLPIG